MQNSYVFTYNKYACIAAFAMIGILGGVYMVYIVDIIQDAFAPAASARGPGHWSGVNKHYRLARGR